MGYVYHKGGPYTSSGSGKFTDLKWKPIGDISNLMQYTGNVDKYNFSKTERSPNSSKLETFEKNKGKKVILTNHSILSENSRMEPGTTWADWKQWSDTNEKGNSSYMHRMSVDTNVVGLINARTLLLGKLTTAQKMDVASRNELYTQALAEANNYDLDLGTTIGELPETLFFVQDAYDAITDSLEKIPRDTLADMRRARTFKYVNLAASGWLMYRYAVMPNVHTIRDFLVSLQPAQYSFERVRKRDSIEVAESGVIPSTAYNIPDVAWEYEFSFVRRLQIYTILTAEQDAKRRHLLNLATTAWELVPLSFVIDWAVQVGDFIASLRCIPYTSRGASFSERTSFKAGASVMNTSKRTKTYAHEDFSIMSHGLFSYTLEKYVREADPKLSITLPVEPDMNWMRSLDAFSLWWSISRKKLSP